MALWGLNNLPGAVALYYPHKLLFGRDPISFGDLSPMVSKDVSEDALKFFNRFSWERTSVRVNSPLSTPGLSLVIECGCATFPSRRTNFLTNSSAYGPDPMNSWKS